jgi:hypothetical protein
MEVGATPFKLLFYRRFIRAFRLLLTYARVNAISLLLSDKEFNQKEAEYGLY